MRSARLAVALLLAINLFNYVDRSILYAVQKPVGEEFHASKGAMGWLVTAFLVTYMLISPLFGWLGDRFSRWKLIGIGVILWSFASGGSGLCNTYLLLLMTRCCIGVGEAAYGPVAPTLLSDYYPVEVRGKILAWFYAAIPVGSALGYVIGGFFAYPGKWHLAFLLTLPPGILLGIFCFFMPEPARGQSDAEQTTHRAQFADYLQLLRNRSYLLNTAAMAALTFAIGGIAAWMPTYLVENRKLKPDSSGAIFGGVLVSAGLAATLAGGWLGDRLRGRVKGSYFFVSALGMLIGFPLFLTMLVTPFPLAWGIIFAAVFFLFFNTGPSNTALANVTSPNVRATAFALNILIIHSLGDALSPPVIGAIGDRWGLPTGFSVVSVMMALGGMIWLVGMRTLDADTRRVTEGRGVAVETSASVTRA